MVHTSIEFAYASRAGMSGAGGSFQGPERERCLSIYTEA